jgi:riboflavin kinase/FMN adenylyltransferase
MRFEAVGVPSVAISGETVSSTAIRGAIQDGDLAHGRNHARPALQRLWHRASGSPTCATTRLPDGKRSAECEQLPPDGVYTIDVDIDGETLPGIANVGLRPTVEKDAQERLVEGHVFDWSGDLVGRDVEIFFRDFLRREKKFSSLETLREQIATDARVARALIAARVPHL